MEPDTSQSYGEWSDWQWSDKWQCHERYRTDPQTGEDEWDYYQQSQPLHNQATPRDFEFNNVNSQIANIHMNNAYFSTGFHRETPTVEHRTIRPRDNGVDFEREDTRFRVHDSKHFKFGKIFKIIWSEPAGASSGGAPTVVTEHAVARNEHCKVRYFLIVKEDRGHCICLPIVTYGRRGVNKPGCHPGHHAVIYDGRHPELLPGEENLISKQSIKCKMDKGQQLDRAARLNYNKIYTVEHNVKVFFIGRVADKNYEQRVVVDYRATHALEDRVIGASMTETTTSFAVGPSEHFSFDHDWQSGPGNGDPGSSQGGHYGF